MSAHGPAPHGAPLTFITDCRTRRDAEEGVPHEVTINPDWSLTTPHDLEAERLGEAFGGWNSCIDLADKSVPDYQRAMATAAESSIGDWRRALPARIDNLAVDGRHNQEVLNAAHHAWVTESAAETARVQGGKTGLDFLWRRGVHPLLAQRLADLVTPVPEQLPVQYFLHAASETLSRDWLRRVVAAYPTATFAAHAARHHPIGSGPSTDDIDLLCLLGESTQAAMLVIEHRLTVDVSRHAAKVFDSTLDQAIHLLAAWGSSGYQLSKEHCTLLAEFGRRPMPESDSVDRLMDVIGTDAPQVDRTDLAVMLSIGTTVELVAVIRSGVRTAAELVATRPNAHRRQGATP